MLKKENCEAAEQHNMRQLPTTTTLQRLQLQCTGITQPITPYSWRHGKNCSQYCQELLSTIHGGHIITPKPPQSITERQNKETATLEKKMLLTLYSAEFLGQIAQKNKLLLKKPIRFESLVPLPGRKALLLQSGRDTEIDSLAPAASLPVVV
jgi:hypothetical protein